MEQQVTRLFILFPIQPFSIGRLTLQLETLWPLSGTHRTSSHPLFVCPSSVPHPSFVRCLCLVSLLLLLSFFYCLYRLYHLLFVRILFFCILSLYLLSVVLYILKSGVPLQDYRPIIIRSGPITSSHAPRVFFAIVLCPRRDFLNTYSRVSASSTINPDRTWYHTYPGHKPEHTPYTYRHQRSFFRLYYIYLYHKIHYLDEKMTIKFVLVVLILLKKSASKIGLAILVQISTGYSSFQIRIYTSLNLITYREN